MKQNLFDHVNLKTENIHLFSGAANNLKEHCEQYDALIAKVGGIDIQLLGLGNNGHIAFRFAKHIALPQISFSAAFRITCSSSLYGAGSP